MSPSSLDKSGGKNIGTPSTTAITESPVMDFLDDVDTLNPSKNNVTNDHENDQLDENGETPSLHISSTMSSPSSSPQQSPKRKTSSNRNPFRIHFLSKIFARSAAKRNNENNNDTVVGATSQDGDGGDHIQEQHADTSTDSEVTRTEDDTKQQLNPMSPNTNAKSAQDRVPKMHPAQARALIERIVNIKSEDGQVGIVPACLMKEFDSDMHKKLLEIIEIRDAEENKKVRNFKVKKVASTSRLGSKNKLF